MANKREIIVCRTEDLPFKVAYTTPEHTYFRLFDFADGRQETVRKVCQLSNQDEVKIYIDDKKYIITNAYSIKDDGIKVVTESQPDWVPDTNNDTDRYEYLKTCVECNIPVYLYGPAGSGKNHSLKELATDLNLDFYFSNSVTQEYKITGFVDANGTFHETEFYRAWTKGGLFFLDELDASLPEVLVLLNAALANGYFDFPGKGRLDAHPDFRCGAAGNTVGTGADEQYTGRMPIDQSTLDRFVFIEWDYDPKVELSLAENDQRLVEFVHALRAANLNTTFSYRCIIYTKKLQAKGISTVQILQTVILKGLPKDAINTLKRPANALNSTYWEALAKMAG